MGGWNSQADGEEAWRIIEASEKLLTKREPRHFKRTPAEIQEMDRIIREQIRLGERACDLGDVEAFREAYAGLVKRSFEAYERQERARDRPAAKLA